jgi:hypothetical protein
MKRSTGPILLSFLTVAAVFAGCSDDPPKENNPTFPPLGGSSGAATAGTPAAMAGTQSASGDGGTSSMAGTDAGGSAGSGGDTGGMAGTGGATAGAAGTAGTAGTGGTPPVAMVELLVDSVVVRKVGSTYGDDMGGEGGAGGMGGDGAGGESVGAGGVADPGAGGVGAGGEGSAPRPEVALSFFFDANLEMWDLQSYGSTPNVGIDGGPEKLSRLSTQTWVAAGGYASPGTMNVKVPFSTKDEQLDIHRGLMAPPDPYKDWSGYEIVAKVKLVNGGAVGECLGAWIYVTTGPVFRFARGNLAAPLVVDDWTELEFELDDPDPNSTPDGVHPEFNPAEVGQLGIHIQSRACAP